MVNIKKFNTQEVRYTCRILRMLADNPDRLVALDVLAQQSSPMRRHGSDLAQVPQHAFQALYVSRLVNYQNKGRGLTITDRGRRFHMMALRLLDFVNRHPALIEDRPQGPVYFLTVLGRQALQNAEDCATARKGPGRPVARPVGQAGKKQARARRPNRGAASTEAAIRDMQNRRNAPGPDSATVDSVEGQPCLPSGSGSCPRCGQAFDTTTHALVRCPRCGRIESTACCHPGPDVLCLECRIAVQSSETVPDVPLPTKRRRQVVI